MKTLTKFIIHYSLFIKTIFIIHYSLFIKRILIFAMALLVITPAFSQVCKKVNTYNGQSYSAKFTKDKNENIYVTGSFSETGLSMKFDNIILNSNGGLDIFIAKLTPDKKCVWAVRAGGKGYDQGQGITIDKNGNIYVTGYFSDTAKFGNFEVKSNGGHDIFIAKYSNKGECLWVKSAGAAEVDEGYGINADNEGNVYVSGHISKKTIFGKITTKNQGGSFFLAKYDGYGNCLWVNTKVSQSSSSSRCYANVIIDNDHIYLTGAYGSGSFRVDSISLPTNTLSNDLFVLKFDKNGRCLQGTNAGGGYVYAQFNQFR